MWLKRQETEKGGRIHDPTSPEMRRSSILNKLNLHFLKKQPLRTNFLILKWTQENEKIFNNFFLTKGKKASRRTKTDQTFPVLKEQEETNFQRKSQRKTRDKKTSLNRKRGKKALCSETKRNLQKARRIGAPPSLPEICSGLKPAVTEM